MNRAPTTKSCISIKEYSLWRIGIIDSVPVNYWLFPFLIAWCAQSEWTWLLRWLVLQSIKTALQKCVLSNYKSFLAVWQRKIEIRLSFLHSHINFTYFFCLGEKRFTLCDRNAQGRRNMQIGLWGKVFACFI